MQPAALRLTGYGRSAGSESEAATVRGSKRASLELWCMDTIEEGLLQTPDPPSPYASAMDWLSEEEANGLPTFVLTCPREDRY